MAYTLIGHTFYASVSVGGTTPSIDTTNADLIVIVEGHDSFGGPATPTDSFGNIYVGRTQYADVAGLAVKIYDCDAPTVGAGHTFSINCGNAGQSICVAAFSGSAVSAFFAENGAANNSATVSINTGSVDPLTNVNALFIAGLNAGGNEVPTIDSSFIITDALAVLGGSHYQIGMAYLIETTASAQNPAWNWSTNLLTDKAADIAIYLASVPPPPPSNVILWAQSVM